MDEETIHKSGDTYSRRGIASYLRRIAGAFDSGKKVPVDEEGTVTVTPPPEADLAVELEREGGRLELELEVEWTERAGDVNTEADASKARFELYEDSAGEWRWRLVHDNGNIIADGGEGYSSAGAAEQGLRSVETNAPGARVVDLSADDRDDGSETAGSDAEFELFEDGAGEWRWRLVHDNGNIIADSGEGYASKQKAKQGLRSVKRNVRGAPVRELD